MTNDSDRTISLSDAWKNTYEIYDKRVLGVGAFATVVEGYHRQQKIPIAIKLSAHAVSLFREVELLAFLKLRNSQNFHIVQPVGWFNVSETETALVLPRLGPTLLEILKQGPFSLALIRNISRQLVESLQFLHSNDVIHTDVKLENILLRYQTAAIHHSEDTHRRGINVYPCMITVIDFSSSLVVSSVEEHPKLITTRCYRAPEVFAVQDSPPHTTRITWSTKCDIWSLACCLWEMYTGKQFTTAQNATEHLPSVQTVRCILKVLRSYWTKLGTYIRPEECTENVEFLDLVLWLLEVDVFRRPCAEDVIKHRFFTNFDRSANH